MTLRWLVAAVHLIALGIGLGAVWVRALALRDAADPRSVARALRADGVWGLAALLWISTGVWRAFGGLEKGSAFYLQNHAFWLKMTLFGLILLLEILPMIALIRWRIALGKAKPLDTRRARAFSAISFVQAALVVGTVLAATAMARGFGAR